jgi:hypothetical protein
VELKCYLRIGGSRRRNFPFAQTPGAAMGRILNDLLLFSCLAAFVTGVVIAAAGLFG